MFVVLWVTAAKISTIIPTPASATEKPKPVIAAFSPVKLEPTEPPIIPKANDMANESSVKVPLIPVWIAVIPADIVPFKNPWIAHVFATAGENAAPNPPAIAPVIAPVLNPCPNPSQKLSPELLATIPPATPPIVAAMIEPTVAAASTPVNPLAPEPIKAPAIAAPPAVNVPAETQVKTTNVKITAEPISIFFHVSEINPLGSRYITGVFAQYAYML